MKDRITIAFSPCPNDTFIFDALVNGKIDTRGITIDPVLRDVEELNRSAHSGAYDITKLSFGAYPGVAAEYVMLDSGAAIGSGVGPLLVSKSKNVFADSSIAIPGEHTTANLLFTMFYPDNTNRSEMIFSRIPDAVANGEYDCGILIHEGRFTYRSKGLHKIADLGELWENRTGMPIPLGCIAARRELGNDKLHLINELIAESVQYAFQNPGEGLSYIRKNAQELDDNVIRKHIELYVNDYSIDLGESGRRAIGHLYDHCVKAGLLSVIKENIFLEKVI
jgi:1,4-dihydroxy-6-naphthoate synthase